MSGTRIVKFKYTQGFDALLEHGPCIRVTVRNPDTDAVIQVDALIDTGASGTAIELVALEKLSPRCVGKTTAAVANTEFREANLYNLVLEFPGGVDVGLAVAGIPNTAGSAPLLIGRDILKFGELTVDFSAGVFYLHLALPDVILD